MNKKRIMYLIEEYATTRTLVHVYGDRDDIPGMKRDEADPDPVASSPHTTQIVHS